MTPAPHCSCKETGLLCSSRLKGALRSGGGGGYWLKKIEAVMEPSGSHAPQVLVKSGLLLSMAKAQEERG